MLLALAGQHDKCKLITEGADVYRDMAATIYGFDRDAFMAIPEKDLSPDETEQRRIGKNGVLRLLAMGSAQKVSIGAFAGHADRRQRARRQDRRGLSQYVGADCAAAVA